MTEFPCKYHVDREATVGDLCWQCYLDKESFERRFGKDFYERPNTKCDSTKGVNNGKS